MNKSEKKKECVGERELDRVTFDSKMFLFLNAGIKRTSMHTQISLIIPRARYRSLSFIIIIII